MKNTLLDKLVEFKIGDLGHGLIDVASAVSDFFSFGAIGPIVDIIHGFLYLHEWKNETDEVKKSILYAQAMITFASVLLPATAQFASTVLKQSLKTTAKTGKVAPGLMDKVRKITTKIKPFFDFIKKMVRVKDRDFDALVTAIKRKKHGASDEALKGYAYLAILGVKLGVDVKYVLKVPETLAERAFNVLSGFDVPSTENI